MNSGRAFRATAVLLMLGAITAVGAQSLAAAAELPAGWVETASGPLGPGDRDLIVRVRLAGLWEQPAGEMAQSQGSSRVKEIGAKIASEHHTLDEQVRAVAASLGVTLPDEPNA